MKKKDDAMNAVHACMLAVLALPCHAAGVDNTGIGGRDAAINGLAAEAVAQDAGSVGDRRGVERVGRGYRSANSLRPIGAIDVKDGEFPWHVALVFEPPAGSRSFGRCGGAHLGNGWILTAAHCVDDFAHRPDAIDVLAGSLSITLPRHAVRADRVILHPCHRSLSTGIQVEDVALVHAAIPSDVPGVALATATDDAALQSSATSPTLHAAGFGLLKAGGGTQDLADWLMRVELPFVPAGICTGPLSYGHRVKPSMMLCAGDAQHDTCSADSGGSLTDSPTPPALLHGIVSWGGGCANARYPGVYARVSRYRDWIAASIAEKQAAAAQCTTPGT